VRQPQGGPGARCGPRCRCCFLRSFPAPCSANELPPPSRTHIRARNTPASACARIHARTRARARARACAPSFHEERAAEPRLLLLRRGGNGQLLSSPPRGAAAAARLMLALQPAQPTPPPPARSALPRACPRCAPLCGPRFGPEFERCRPSVEGGARRDAEGAAHAQRRGKEERKRGA